MKFGTGDMVLVYKGRKTNFYEVIDIKGKYACISDGWVQITKHFDEMELLCKAEQRLDKKVPFIKFVN